MLCCDKIQLPFTYWVTEQIRPLSLLLWHAMPSESMFKHVVMKQIVTNQFKFSYCLSSFIYVMSFPEHSPTAFWYLILPSTILSLVCISFCVCLVWFVFLLFIVLVGILIVCFCCRFWFSFVLFFLRRKEEKLPWIYFGLLVMKETKLLTSELDSYSF